MAYITFQPSDYFNTVTWTGTASSPVNVTGFGFQPDWVWNKYRAGAGDHQVYDAVRGATKMIIPNSTANESTNANGVTAFITDGFTAGSDINVNGGNSVAWGWKAGTTSGIATNGTTTITPSAYSFNQTSGVSIVKYTGNGVNGAALAHGLGAEPEIIIARSTNLNGEPWQVYSKKLGNDKRLFLNLTNAETSATEWYSTTPDSVNIRLGNGTHINSNTNTFIAYCFAGKKGFSKFGFYEGNGNNSGPFQYTGFKPAWILIKAKGQSESWYILDAKRPGRNNNNYYLTANNNSAEGTSTSLAMNILSNGFKINNTDTSMNSSGQGYIYMAFADVPLVASNGDPATAR